MFRIFCVLIGYALGMLQSAYFLGRVVGKIDIREFGSGNAGFTNATRVLGKKVGALVFLFDFLKVIVVFLICSFVFKEAGKVAGLYAGLGAVLGHNFPFYLGFRGGKGIACTLGLMLFFNWQIALITYGIGFIVFMAKKYISLSSLTMTLIYPIIMVILKGKFGFSIEEILLMCLLCILAFIKHRANIERLLKGNENKFGSKKKEN